MEQLSNETIVHILEYLDLTEVYNLGTTSSLFSQVAFESTAADDFFLRRFHARFGQPHTSGWGEVIGGRAHWRDLYFLRKRVIEAEKAANERCCATNGQKVEIPDTGLQTLGFLTPEQEAATLDLDYPKLPLEDINAWLATPDYYGFTELIPRGMIIAWGSFKGLRVFPTIHDLIDMVSSGVDEAESQFARSRVRSFLDRDGWFLTAGIWGPMDPGIRHVNYFGFSTGDLVAFSLPEAIDWEHSTYGLKELCHRKCDSEVRAVDLAHQFCGGSVVSSHKDGSIWLYPEAARTHSFDVGYKIAELQADLKRSYILDSSSNGFLSFVRRTNEKSYQEELLFVKYHLQGSIETTGPRDVTVIPLSPKALGLDDSDYIFCSGLAGHLPPILQDSTNSMTQLIVLGTEEGCVIFLGWSPQSPTSLRFLHKCHPDKDYKAISAINRTGSLLIFSTVRAGRMIFYDLNTLTVLHSTQVHPGRRSRYSQSEIQYPAVVGCDLYHDRQSVISICRDGHVHEWQYGEDHATCTRHDSHTLPSSQWNRP